MNHARLKKKTRIAHHGHSFPQQAFPVAYDKRFQVPPCSTAHRNEMTMLRDLFLPLMGNDNLKDTYLFFYDLNAKFTYDINNKNKIFLSGYYGNGRCR